MMFYWFLYPYGQVNSYLMGWRDLSFLVNLVRLIELAARDDGAAHPAHPERLPARVHHHGRRGDLPRHHHHVLAAQDGVHRFVTFLGMILGVHV